MTGEGPRILKLGGNTTAYRGRIFDIGLIFVSHDFEVGSK